MLTSQDVKASKMTASIINHSPNNCLCRGKISSKNSSQMAFNTVQLIKYHSFDSILFLRTTQKAPHHQKTRKKFENLKNLFNIHFFDVISTTRLTIHQLYYTISWDKVYNALDYALCGWPTIQCWLVWCKVIHLLSYIHDSRLEQYNARLLLLW
jgi:hypothetical protein